MISLYDEVLPKEEVIHRSGKTNNEIERSVETRNSLAKTSDLFNQPLVIGLAGAGIAVIAVGVISRRKKREK